MFLLRLILVVTFTAVGLAAAIVGLQVPLLGLLMLAGVAWASVGSGWKGSGTSHGTARTANRFDLIANGMLGDSGVILGSTGYLPPPTPGQAIAALFSPSVRSDVACRLVLSAFGGSASAKEELIRVNNPVHLATFAPTGRGKGVSVLIPNLLTYPHSCVVLDPKGENFQATAEHRQQKLGHRLLLLDPFGACKAWSDAYNPLDFIDETADDFLDQCRDLANMLVVRAGTEPEPHWNDMGELVLTTFIAFVCACEPDRKERNLAAVRAIVSDPNRYAKALEVMKQQGDEFGGVLSKLANQLGWLADKELGSVLTTVQRHTNFLDSPPVAVNTRESSFHPRDLRSGPVTLYLVLPHDKLASLSPLLRLWVGSILRVLTRGHASERHPVMFFIDEAAHLGKIRVLEDAVTMMRGMGIRLWFFFQSLGQLQECFGDRATKFIDNIDTQQYFGSNAFESADAISKRIGDTTIVIESLNKTTSRSRPDGTQGGHHQSGGTYSTSSSTTYSETGRRVFKPEELLTLPEDLALVFHRNLPVIPAKLHKYFEPNQPFFTNAGEKTRKATFSAAYTVAALLILLGILVLVAVPSPQPEPPAIPVPVVTPSPYQPDNTSDLSSSGDLPPSRSHGLGSPLPAPPQRPLPRRSSRPGGKPGESGHLIQIR